jgi:hypothetical protein
MSDILMGDIRLIAGGLIELNQCDAKKAAFSWRPFRTAENAPTPWVLKMVAQCGEPRTKVAGAVPEC